MTAPEVKVTQAAREVAWRFMPINSIAGQDRAGVMRGDYDDTPTVYLIAAFEAEARATATAPLEARIAALEGAMGEAVGLIAQMFEHGRVHVALMGNPIEVEALEATARNTLASLRAMLADDGEK